jgi:hypothetical protein
VKELEALEPHGLCTMVVSQNQSPVAPVSAARRCLQHFRGEEFGILWNANVKYIVEG